MTGPDHYREAERLLEVAGSLDTDESNERYCLAAAQVHATLALIAATINAAAHPNQSQVDYLGQWWEAQR